MGQIIIEIPQYFDRNYRLVSHESAEDILSKVENLIAQTNAVREDEIVNLLTDREESALEIAGEARKSWKRKL